MDVDTALVLVYLWQSFSCSLTTFNGIISYPTTTPIAAGPHFVILALDPWSQLDLLSCVPLAIYLFIKVYTLHYMMLGSTI